MKKQMEQERIGHINVKKFVKNKVVMEKILELSLKQAKKQANSKRLNYDFDNEVQTRNNNQMAELTRA